MKYIPSLLALLLLLPSVAFGQTVQTSWTRDVAKALIYPLYSNDKVGIGTTSPWTKFAVTGSTTIAGGPLIVLGSANTPISADTDWYRQFGLFRKDINDYAFMTLENRNGGSNASVDLLWNNERTTASSYYADIGFNSSAFNNPAFPNLNVANALYGYNPDGPILWATGTTSSAGYFDFTTGGYSSSRMRITSTGNVGIGTTSPVRLLSLEGVGGAFFRIQRSDSSGANAAIEFTGNDGGIDGSISYNNRVGGAITFETGGPTNTRMTIDSTGNVGIGTTSPGGVLHVGAGTTGTNDTNLIIDSGSGTGAEPQLRFNRNSVLRSAIYVQSPTENLTFFTGAADRMVITTAGNVGIGTTSPARPLDVWGNISSSNLTSNTTIQMGTVSTGSGAAFIQGSNNANNAVKNLVLQPNGSNVGIGTSTPGTALTVNGTITSTSTPPTLSSCGTSPKVTGNNNWGEVTTGATATGCTVTFATAFPTFASCVVTNQSMSLVNAMTYTDSRTGFTVTQTGLGGSIINYRCDGF